MRKLPVFATIAHVWRTSFPNLGTAFLVSWPWLLVLVPISYFGNSLADPADLVAGRYFQELAATLLVALATLFAFSSIAIAWHRFLLKGEVAQGWSRLRVDAAVWAYFRDTMLIIAAVAVIVLPGVLITRLASTWSMGPLGIFMILQGAKTFMFGALAIFYRLSVKLPAIALGEEEFTFRQALRATKGHKWKVIGLGLLLLAVVLAFGFGSIAVGGVLLYLPQGGLLAYTVFQVLTFWIGTVFGVTTLTALYSFFVQGKDVEH